MTTGMQRLPQPEILEKKTFDRKDDDEIQQSQSNPESGQLHKDKLTAMQCLQDSLVGREYYHPTEEGLEGRFKTRLETIKAWKKEHGGK